MTYSEKVKSYRQLIENIKNCPKLSDCNSSRSSKAIQLEKCPFCSEVNLWSYWQGGINNLDADILLVGQDWGNYHDTKYDGIFKSPDSFFKYPFKENPTDKNLSNLFAVLGDAYDISKSNNPKVFFTNLVLCYRKGSGISGGFRQKWARNCSGYFVKLVGIIQPKVIICLGRSVFDAVVRAAGNKPPKCDYNYTISKGAQMLTFNNTTCAVFPMAHCGILGTRNRNDTKELSVQTSDWSKIKEYL